MAKWYGVIGYVSTVETVPGVWEEQVIERKYYGDVRRNTRRLQTTDQLNDDITVSNEISIIADPYANLNFHDMRYVEFKGVKWKITNVEVEPPRLNLTVGGVYNVQQT